VLLIQRKNEPYKNCWAFPGGFMEIDETIEQCAVRELREETGFVSNKMIRLDSFYQDEGVSAAYNHSFLALDAIKLYDQDLDESEIIRYETLTYDELLEAEKMGLISGCNTKLTLSRIKEYERNNLYV
jgi:ADP-ribose pyrophosphatase YjhB (NUDIX family)